MRTRESDRQIWFACCWACEQNYGLVAASWNMGASESGRQSQLVLSTEIPVPLPSLFVS